MSVNAQRVEWIATPGSNFASGDAGLTGKDGLRLAIGTVALRVPL
jgi:hypothetical protein